MSSFNGIDHSAHGSRAGRADRVRCVEAVRNREGKIKHKVYKKYVSIREGNVTRVVSEVE